MRIDGPSRAYLDAQGEAFEDLVTRGIEQALKVATKDLKSTWTGDDLATIERVFTQYTIDRLIPWLADSYLEAQMSQRQRLLDAVLTAGATFHLPGKHNQKDHGHGMRKGNAELIESKAREGGFTFRPFDRSVPATGFAVSPYPQRSEVIDTKDLTADHVKAYARRNKDLLDKPDHHLGAWRDQEGGADQVWLDVTVVKSGQAAAETVAKAANQKAIYDLGSGNVIDTGGTGEASGSTGAFDSGRHHGRGPGGPVRGDHQGLTAATMPVPTPASTLADQYLATASNRLRGISDEVWQHARKELHAGMLAGESIPQLRKRVQATIGVSAPRATMIARTEVIGAQNRGSLDQMIAAGFQGTKTWLATRDHRTRASHARANRQERAIVQPGDTEFSVGGVSMDGPHDPSAPPGETINCVVGSTQVEWPGQVVDATTRRRYDGEFIQIITAAGHDLTVTPNHPILTPTGYVPAGSLRPGQHVLATPAPPAPQVDDGPPSIEQVMGTALQVGPPDRIGGSAVDFHGDGTDAEVEIVRTDRDLGFQRDLKFGRQPSQETFVRLLMAVGRLMSPGVEKTRLEAFLGRIGQPIDSTPGSVSTSDQITALLERHAPQAYLIRLTARARYEAQFGQAPDDERTTNLEVTRHRKDALTAGVAPCEIVKVERFTGSHDVFNLQTSQGWYIGNGIVQHNCRCTLIYDLDDDKAQEATEGFGDWTQLDEDSAIQQMFPPSMRSEITDEVAALTREALNNVTMFGRGEHAVLVNHLDRMDTARLKRMFTATDELLRAFPPKPGQALMMAIGETGNAYGLTRVGLHSITLDARLFEKVYPASYFQTGDKHFMPVADQAHGIEYVLAHEWGHAIEGDPGAQTARAVEGKATLLSMYRKFKYDDDLSGYGGTSTHEAYAESFAEWWLTRGRTTNPVAQAYAREFDWRLP